MVASGDADFVHERLDEGFLGGGLAVFGVLAIVGGWLLSRPHDKPARKRYRLP